MAGRQGPDDTGPWRHPGPRECPPPATPRDNTPSTEEWPSLDSTRHARNIAQATPRATGLHVNSRRSEPGYPGNGHARASPRQAVEAAVVRERAILVAEGKHAGSDSIWARLQRNPLNINYREAQQAFSNTGLSNLERNLTIFLEAYKVTRWVVTLADLKRDLRTFATKHLNSETAQGFKALNIGPMLQHPLVQALFTGLFHKGVCPPQSKEAIWRKVEMHEVYRAISRVRHGNRNTPMDQLMALVRTELVQRYASATFEDLGILLPASLALGIHWLNGNDRLFRDHLNSIKQLNKDGLKSAWFAAKNELIKIQKRHLSKLAEDSLQKLCSWLSVDGDSLLSCLSLVATSKQQVVGALLSLEQNGASGKVTHAPSLGPSPSSLLELATYASTLEASMNVEAHCQAIIPETLKQLQWLAPEAFQEVLQPLIPALFRRLGSSSSLHGPDNSMHRVMDDSVHAGLNHSPSRTPVHLDDGELLAKFVHLVHRVLDECTVEEAGEQLISRVFQATPSTVCVQRALQKFWREDAIAQLLLRTVHKLLEEGPIRDAHVADPGPVREAATSYLQEEVRLAWQGMSLNSLADMEAHVLSALQGAGKQLPGGTQTLLQFLRNKSASRFAESLTGWPNKVDVGVVQRDDVIKFVERVLMSTEHFKYEESLQAKAVDAAVQAHFRVPNTLRLGYGPLAPLLKQAAQAEHNPDPGVLVPWAALAITKKGFTAPAEMDTGHNQAAMLALNAAPVMSDLATWSDWASLHEKACGPLPAYIRDHAVDIEFQVLEMPGGALLKLPARMELGSDRWSSVEKAVQQGNPDLLIGLLLADVVHHNGMAACSRHLTEWKDVLQHQLRSSITSSRSCAPGAQDAACLFVLQCLQLLPVPFAPELASDVLLPALQGALGNQEAARAGLLSAAVKADGLRTGPTSWSVPSAQQRLRLLGNLMRYEEWIAHEHKVAPQSVTSQEILTIDSLQLIPALSIAMPIPELSPAAAPQHLELGVGAVLNPGTPSGAEVVLPGQRTLPSTPLSGSVLSLPDMNESLHGSADPFRRQEVVQAIRAENGVQTDGSTLETFKRVQQSIMNAVEVLSKDIYADDVHFVMELVQNADDNQYARLAPGDVPRLEMVLSSHAITILNNEDGFTDAGVRAICSIGDSTKKNLQGYIGQKGIGFKSVFRVTDCPEIHSNGFHFSFNTGPPLFKLGTLAPTWVNSSHDALTFVLHSSGMVAELQHSNSDKAPAASALLEAGGGLTAIHLPLKSNLTDDVMGRISALQPQLLLFLKQLRRLTITDNRIGKVKEMSLECGAGEDLVRLVVREGQPSAPSDLSTSTNTLWLMMRQSVSPRGIHRRDAEIAATDVAVAFSLDTPPDDPRPKGQYVFAYLPVAKYGLKFTVQADFVLNASRGELDYDNPWNRMLRDHIPPLFVQTLEKFKEPASLPDMPGFFWLDWWLRCVPLDDHGVHDFFSSLSNDISIQLKGRPCMPVLLPSPSASKEVQVAWKRPCQAVVCKDPVLRDLLPAKYLEEQNRYMLHPDVHVLFECEPLRRLLGVAVLDQSMVIDVIRSKAKDGMLQTCMAGDMRQLQRLLLCIASAPLEQLHRLRAVPLLPVYGQGLECLHPAQSSQDQSERAMMFLSPWPSPGNRATESPARRRTPAMTKRATMLEACGLTLDVLAGRVTSSCIPAIPQPLQFVDPKLLDFKEASDENTVRRLLQELDVQELSEEDVLERFILPVLERWSASLQDRHKQPMDSDTREYPGDRSGLTSPLPEEDQRLLLGMLQYPLLSGQITQQDLQSGVQRGAGSAAHAGGAAHAVAGSAGSLVARLVKCAVVLTEAGMATTLAGPGHPSGSPSDGQSPSPPFTPVYVPRQLGNDWDLPSLFPSAEWCMVSRAYSGPLPNGLKAPSQDTWRMLLTALGAQVFLPIVPATQQEGPVQAYRLTAPKTKLVHDWDCPGFAALLQRIMSESDQDVQRVQLLNLAQVMSSQWPGIKSRGCLQKVAVAGKHADPSPAELPYVSHVPAQHTSSLYQAEPSSFMQQLTQLRWLLASDGAPRAPSDLFYQTPDVTRLLGEDDVPYLHSRLQSENRQHSAMRKMLDDLGVQSQVTLDAALAVLTRWSLSGHGSSGGSWGHATAEKRSIRVSSLEQMSALYIHIGSLVTDSSQLDSTSNEQLLAFEQSRPSGHGSAGLIDRLKTARAFATQPLIWLPLPAVLLREAEAVSTNFEDSLLNDDMHGIELPATGSAFRPPSFRLSELASSNVTPAADQSLILQIFDKDGMLDHRLRGRRLVGGFYHCDELCYLDGSHALEPLHLLLAATGQPNVSTRRVMSAYYGWQRDLYTLFVRQLTDAKPTTGGGTFRMSLFGPQKGYCQVADYCRALDALTASDNRRLNSQSVTHHLVMSVLKTWSDDLRIGKIQGPAREALRRALAEPGRAFFPTIAGTYAALADGALVLADDIELAAIFQDVPGLILLSFGCGENNTYDALLQLADIPKLTDLPRQQRPYMQHAQHKRQESVDMVHRIQAAVPLLQRRLLQRLGLQAYEQASARIAPRLANMRFIPCDSLEVEYALTVKHIDDVIIRRKVIEAMWWRAAPDGTSADAQDQLLFADLSELHEVSKAFAELVAAAANTPVKESTAGGDQIQGQTAPDATIIELNHQQDLAKDLSELLTWQERGKAVVSHSLAKLLALPADSHLWTVPEVDVGEALEQCEADPCKLLDTFGNVASDPAPLNDVQSQDESPAVDEEDIARKIRELEEQQRIYQESVAARRAAAAAPQPSNDRDAHEGQNPTHAPSELNLDKGTVELQPDVLRLLPAFTTTPAAPTVPAGFTSNDPLPPDEDDDHSAVHSRPRDLMETARFAGMTNTSDPGAGAGAGLVTVGAGPRDASDGGLISRFRPVDRATTAAFHEPRMGEPTLLVFTPEDVAADAIGDDSPPIMPAQCSDGSLELGRWGEETFYRYLCHLHGCGQLLDRLQLVHGVNVGESATGQHGELHVLWVNEEAERGMPFDVLVFRHEHTTRLTTTAAAARLCAEEVVKAAENFYPEPLDGQGYDAATSLVELSNGMRVVFLAVIEVKTTSKPAKANGFELSSNELDCARIKGDWYQVWRLYKADDAREPWKVKHFTNPYALWRKQLLTVQMWATGSRTDARTLDPMEGASSSQA